MAWMRSDDLDGTPASLETFGWNGKAYSVSLGDANRAKLEKALQPFLTVASPYASLPSPPEEKIVLVSSQAEPEPLTPEPAPQPKATPRQRRRQARAGTPVIAAGTPHKTIRAWANENGYQVGPQGRIPKAIMEAFAAQQAG